MMTDKKRRVEVFSAGCGVCDEGVELVKKLACGSCEVEVLDTHDREVAATAERYGVHSLPAVAVDGKLADCCSGGGLQESSLRAAGIGAPL